MKPWSHRSHLTVTTGDVHPKDTRRPPFTRSTSTVCPLFRPRTPQPLCSVTVRCVDGDNTQPADVSPLFSCPFWSVFHPFHLDLHIGPRASLPGFFRDLSGFSPNSGRSGQLGRARVAYLIPTRDCACACDRGRVTIDSARVLCPLDSLVFVGPVLWFSTHLPTRYHYMLWSGAFSPQFMRFA